MVLVIECITRTVPVTRTYDHMGRLIGEHVVNEAGVPLSDSYSYDLRGNRVQKIGGEPDNLITETTDYIYDLNNKIIREDSHSYNEETQLHTYGDVQYYYDNNGNQVAKQVSGVLSDSRAVMSGRGAETGLSIYRYDAFNRLSTYNSGASEATYAYGADNLRASKTVNRVTTDFVWNGQNLAAESTGDNTNTYTYDMNGVHIANINGVVSTYLKDYHGNVIGKVDVDGEVMQGSGEIQNYDAFGNRWNGAAPDPFGYCGEYLDSENGLIYLRNRYYDSTTGRFISEDPIRDGLNWYSYCGGNPVMFVDPLGYAITDEDRTYLNASEIEMLEQYTYEYEQAEKNGDYLGMNRASANATQLREDNYDYKDNYDYTHGGKVTTLYYEDEDVKGNIYLLKDMTIEEARKQSTKENDIVVRDLRDDETNPAIEIMDASRGETKSQRLSILTVIADYEKSNPTKWTRDDDVEDMEDEWWLHIKFDIGPLKDNGRDAHIDNKRSGAPPIV